MYQTSHYLYTLRHFIRRFRPGSQHNHSLSFPALLLIIAICHITAVSCIAALERSLITVIWLCHA